VKKILLSAMVLMVLASCKEPNVKPKNTDYVIDAFGTELEVIKIEGCEYLLIYYSKSKSLCHKGNCKNPIHKQQ
jgi:hypothetical protein